MVKATNHNNLPSHREWRNSIAFALVVLSLLGMTEACCLTENRPPEHHTSKRIPAKKGGLLKKNEMEVVGNHLKFAKLQPGEFSTEWEFDYGLAHTQKTTIKLTYSFWMLSTEVDQRLYKAVVGKNPSIFKGKNSDCPVENVTWEEATEFCKLLSKLLDEQLPNGYVVRLPTEAEWEYGCRSGNSGKFCFGDRLDLLSEYAWYERNLKGPKPVGLKKANLWGLQDMHGNVAEWCFDFLYPLKKVVPSNPNAVVHLANPVRSVSSEKFRVIKGGSFLQPALRCRSARRSGRWQTKRDFEVGFRFVIGPEIGRLKSLKSLEDRMTVKIAEPHSPPQPKP